MQIQENIQQEKLPMLKKWSNPFQLRTLFKLAEKFPRFYFATCFILGLFGIIFLLAFPYLLLTIPLDLYSSILQASSLEHWIEIGIYSVVFLASAMFCWAIIRLKFSRPSGVEVTQKSFPQLFQHIQVLLEEFGYKKLPRIILRDKYELRVVKTPANGMLFKNHNTLVIGLPVLLSHSPTYFRVLLAGSIGQLSAKHTPFTTWLYFQVDFWSQLKSTALKSKNIFARILGYLLKPYNALFSRWLMPLVEQEALEADRYSMDMVSDQDLAEAIVYEEVVTHFLVTKFWPKINQIARRNNKPGITPYAQMSKVIRNGMTSEELSTIIKQAINKPVDSYTGTPSMNKRLNHMGHAQPVPPKKMQKSAAEELLGQNLSNMIQLFDKHWLKKINATGKGR